MDEKILTALKGFVFFDEVDGMTTGYEEIVQCVLQLPGVKRAQHGQV
jgi:hypothetical protein